MGSSAGITQKHCSLENKSLSIVSIRFCFLLLPSGAHGSFLWVPFTQSQIQSFSPLRTKFSFCLQGDPIRWSSSHLLWSPLVCVSCVPARGLSCDPQSCQVPPPPLLFQWYHRVPLLLWADSKSRHASSWPSTLWPEFSAVSREAVVGHCRVVCHPLFAEPSERAGGACVLRTHTAPLLCPIPCLCPAWWVGGAQWRIARGPLVPLSPACVHVLFTYIFRSGIVTPVLLSANI